MEKKTFKTEWAGRELTIETGQLANQANGSVTVRYGDTMILATATMEDKDREGIDYLPLMVDYEERFYAAGKIKGSRWVKREGRPSEEGILTGRLIDRSIRPLFDPRIRKDTQVIVTVFSIDEENDPDILSVLGASLALGISNIPFNGPIAGCRVAKKDSEVSINASYEQRKDCDLDVVVVGNKGKINMLEGEISEVPDEEVLNLISKCTPDIESLIDFQEKIIKEIGKEKTEITFPEIDQEVKTKAQKIIDKKLESSTFKKSKGEYKEGMKSIKSELFQEFPDYKNEIDMMLEASMDKLIHIKALGEDERQDGRELDAVRELKGEISLFPRTHGSALFSRGDTQVASSVTLASPGAELFLDTMETTEGRKGFMHHYNFPPYSVGEVRPMRGPGRREIGHGFLAEKALNAIIPKKETFPYTIRVVSETLSSNGSSSMASVCASSLALMDTGVPIKSHVAGIAMGLVTDGKDYKILTDIQGPEDHHGDMDLKVAGTRKGVTAIQMDVKIDGVTLEILKDAFNKARDARFKILDVLEATISEPKPLSPHAPKIKMIKIDPEKIGKVIGSGGKIINEIIDTTGAQIDIEDDGSVSVTSPNEESLKKAIDWIESLTREAKVGDKFEGTVKTITDFGAFIEVLPGQDGLLHKTKAKGPMKVGDKANVIVNRIDDKGRIDLALA